MSADPGDQAMSEQAPAGHQPASPEQMAQMDAGALHAELARAMSEVADAQAAYADAVQSKLEAIDARDESATRYARESASARLALVHRAEARASAVRSALRAVREAQGSECAGAAAERFVDVEDFVAHYLSPTVIRKMSGGVVWCPRWWAHPEAANRLWAMWRGYESARLQEGGSLSRWWVNQVDPHLEILLSDRGPFSECRKGQHRVGSGLSHERAPEGWWTVRSGDFDTPVVCEPTGDATDEMEGSTP